MDPPPHAPRAKPPPRHVKQPLARRWFRYDNTWDAWNWQNNSGVIFNIDAMLTATDLSYSRPGMV